MDAAARPGRDPRGRPRFRARGQRLRGAERALSGPGDFSVAVLCTGNRARSPLAAAFLRELTAGLPVEIRSAGVLDLGPVGALEGALEAAAIWGADLSSHRAAWAGGLDLSPYDLVVGFERQHVAYAVVEAGAPLERSFTLPELVGLLREGPLREGTDPAQRARLAVAAAAARRTNRTGRVAEVADPLGGSPATYRRTAETIRELCEELVTALFGPVEVARLTG